MGERTASVGIGLGVLALALAGCRGEEVARVTLTAVGQSSAATFTTDGAADLQVWIDYDGAWTGHEDEPGLSYAVQVLEGAAPVQALTCATSSCNTRICGTTISIGNRQDSDCECKTSCTVKIARAGTFTVQATSAASGDFAGTKLSLVLRK